VARVWWWPRRRTLSVSLSFSHTHYTVYMNIHNNIIMYLFTTQHLSRLERRISSSAGGGPVEPPDEGSNILLSPSSSSSAAQPRWMYVGIIYAYTPHKQPVSRE